MKTKQQIKERLDHLKSLRKTAQADVENGERIKATDFIMGIRLSALSNIDGQIKALKEVISEN